MGKIKEYTWKCLYCNEVFRTRKEKQDHYNKNPEHRTNHKYKNKKEYICEYCNKKWITTIEGFKNHLNYCNENPSKKSYFWTGKKHTKESKLKISESISVNNHGGRCKWFEYNGINLQGTWELAIAKKLDQFSISWIKTKEKRYILEYIDDNKKSHSYNPDFYLKDYNCFLEIKGYWWGKDKRKMELVMQQNPNVKIKIIEKDLFALLTSTENKEDFIKLLEV